MNVLKSALLILQVRRPPLNAENHGFVVQFLA